MHYVPDKMLLEFAHAVSWYFPKRWSHASCTRTVYSWKLKTNLAAQYFIIECDIKCNEVIWDAYCVSVICDSHNPQNNKNYNTLRIISRLSFTSQLHKYM